jgi:hypothetical protein
MGAFDFEKVNGFIRQGLDGVIASRARSGPIPLPSVVPQMESWKEL